MMNLTEQGNFIKIGARELSKDQAEILLPTYQSIIKQVEKFRKNAASTDRNYDEYKLIGTKSALEENYSNSISILGTRGSGKTSILLTLKKHFGKDTVSNITLPMIIPEFIGKSNDTLGWILGYLEDEIKKLEKLDKEASFYRGESNKYNERMSLKYPKERITEEFNKLCQTYFFRKKSYNEYIQNKNEGTADYIRDKQLSLRSDLLLINQFKGFIDMLVHKKKMLDSNQQREPMFMLFFDDVDISSERCSEVLDVIRTYLSHKNIVVFVSGDYNTFAEALTLEFLQREKIPEKHYKEEFVLTSREEILSGVVKNRTILETRKQLSQEYLKKTLPPSLRFEMKALNNIDKMSFKYEFENEKSKEKEISLIQLIERKLKKDSSIVGNSLKTYHFDIFDDNPRSLINVYYYLSNLEDTDSEYQRYVNLKGFLKIILETSPKLKEYSSEIYKFIKINANKNHSDAYIDYNYLKKVFKNYLTIENNKENNLIKLNTTQIINDIINLFILGDLIYKLVGEDRNKNKNIMFASIINQFNESLLPQIQDSDITKSNNVLELLIQFVKDLNNNISSQELNNLFTIKPKQNYSAEMYYFDAFIENFAVYGGKKKKDHKVDIFFEIYKHDEKWVKNKLEFAFKISKNENSIIKQAVKRNISILGNIPGMKDFLLKNENDINSYLSNNTIKNVINLTQKNIRWVSNEFQQKSSVESFGIFGIDDYNNIVDIGIELDKDIMVKELTSTLDYVISEVYERIGNLSSKKLVLVSTTFIESINDLFDKFLQGLKRDIVYLDFLNNIQGTKVIELEKFEMFLDSLENRSYEMAPRMRRGFVEQIKDLRNNPELGNFIIENNELNFHLEIEDGETQQIIIVETMILIGITVILEYFRIESDESLNYFFNINNSLYNCKVAKESGINKIKKGKFIKVIENIQGNSNADH